MKRFEQYLTESQRNYRYTIKIAGEVDQKKLQAFRRGLDKFDPVSITDVKNTPIQASPAGFDHLKNESIGVFKVDFKYPATEPQVLEIARLNGLDTNRIRVIDTEYDDSVSHTASQVAHQYDKGPLLTSDFNDDSDGKKASKLYSEQYRSLFPQKSDIKLTGPKTVENTVSVKEEPKHSPLSSVRLPARPKTGRTK